MSRYEKLRREMVDQQVLSRGIQDERVIDAMSEVPRERFLSDRLSEFAYADAPLPIEAGQTISQPYIVALMIEAAQIEPSDRVLEIGSGSGYAAGVLSRLAAEVYGVERHQVLVRLAQQRLNELAYTNATILHGDGTKGLPRFAPFDAIVVSAGGPEVPSGLLEQLKIGGRLVMPIGDEPRSQELLLIRRNGEHTYDEESLGMVRFVPLIGSEGWTADGTPVPAQRATKRLRLSEHERHEVSGLIADACEPIPDIESVPLDGLLERISDSRVVLIGEATHGTSEFYRMRARITRELVERRGFNIVALEADWPDTATFDQRVRQLEPIPLRTAPFSRFPTWMWRNAETHDFIDWLAEHNAHRQDPTSKVSIHGLDLYSLNNSIGAVLDYLDRVDPETAESARVRYNCFSPWETDPTTYGRAVVGGALPGCEREVMSILNGLFAQRMQYIEADGDVFFDALRNAVVIREAERYYREMYYGSSESWNLRDKHMFETLQAVLAQRGPDAKAVVWAHNSHVGDARATEMGARSELNLGQLVREAYGEKSYRIGMGTDHGTVCAANNWDEPMEIMPVQPSHEDSYERLCHSARVPRFMLPLRRADNPKINEALRPPHLQRAIGVIYRPDTEMLSHYFQAVLPGQFDEFIWFDETRALHALHAKELAGVPEMYPFGL